MFEKHKSRKPDSNRSQAATDNYSSSTKPDSTGSSGRAAVIGPGIHINGEIGGDENLLIEGRVDGKIKLELNQVEIGQNGRVNADIKARVIKVAGEVRGDLTGVEKVIISRSGNVHGNIVTPRMVLEDGAKFKGSIDMDPDEPVTPGVSKPVSKKTVNKNAEKATASPKVVATDKAKENGTYSLHGG